MIRAFAILILSLVSWITSGPALAASASAEEVLFGLLINEERARSSLSPVSFDEELLMAARNHSMRMAAAGRVFHNSNLPNEVSGWLVLGENVGRGNTVEVIHDAFMTSPTHRAEILYPEYRGFAVGTIVSGGLIWVTELFVTRQAPVIAGERNVSPTRDQPESPVPRPVSTASRPPAVAVPESLQFIPEKRASLPAAALALLVICVDGYLLRLADRRAASAV